MNIKICGILYIAAQISAEVKKKRSKNSHPKIPFVLWHRGGTTLAEFQKKQEKHAQKPIIEPSRYSKVTSYEMCTMALSKSNWNKYRREYSKKGVISYKTLTSMLFVKSAFCHH